MLTGKEGMDKQIVIWNDDSDLKGAMFNILLRRGYNPVVLEKKQKIGKAIELLEPGLVVLEGNQELGATVVLSGDSIHTESAGEVSFILPMGINYDEQEGVLQGKVLLNLRKPFGTEQFLGALDKAIYLKAKIEESPLFTDQYIELRRLKSEEDIWVSLQLRNEIYSEVGFVSSRSCGAEFDEYDPHSIHFGAFVKHQGRRELAGSLRVIRSEGYGPHRKELRSAFNARGLRLPFKKDVCDGNLPACESFDISPQQLKSFITGFGTTMSNSGDKVDGEIYELSRLVISSKYRRSRLGIERRLFELIVMDSMIEEPGRNWYTIAVHPDNANKFRKLGFTSISQLGTGFYTGISQPAVLMALDLRRYLSTPNPFSGNLQEKCTIYGTRGSLINNVEISIEEIMPERKQQAS